MYLINTTELLHLKTVKMVKKKQLCKCRALFGTIIIQFDRDLSEQLLLAGVDPKHESYNTLQSLSWRAGWGAT